jgi:hypothetical protein
VPSAAKKAAQSIKLSRAILNTPALSQKHPPMAAKIKGIASRSAEAIVVELKRISSMALMPPSEGFVQFFCFC